MSSFFDDAFDQFGLSSADPIRLDPGATQAWRDSVDFTKGLDNAKAPSLASAGNVAGTIAKAAGVKGSSFAAKAGDTDQPGQPTAAGVGSETGSAIGSGLLVRGVVIVLGFVFVGVGLTMFRPATILQKVTS